MYNNFKLNYLNKARVTRYNKIVSLLLNLFLEEVSWRCSVRNMFLISLQSFLCQYETLLKQVFSEIFKNNVLLVMSR